MFGGHEEMTYKCVISKSSIGPNVRSEHRLMARIRILVSVWSKANKTKRRLALCYPLLGTVLPLPPLIIPLPLRSRFCQLGEAPGIAVRTVQFDATVFR